MNRLLPLVLVVSLSCIFKIQSSERILYVDQFYEILGNKTKENNLLNFTISNGFNKIILYDLHKINKAYPLADATKNGILAKFIAKAKSTYGIKEVGGSGESGQFFIDAIHAYNKSRKKTIEKFDAYNLEYEYWKEDDSKDGGYYCENYLKQNGKNCNRKETFNFFIKSLAIMKKLAKENEHKVKVEAYVGKFKRHEIHTISNYVDRLLVHVYVRSPKIGFNYANKRLQYLAEVKNKPKVSIIYSSETLFMGGWLKFNSLKRGEKIFIDTMKNRSKHLLSKINFTNFTYYNYNQLSKSLKYYKELNKFAKSKDKGEATIMASR